MILPVIAAFLIAFVTTLFLTPIVARHAKRAGFVGIDVHKRNKPTIPEFGGIAIAAGVFAALLFAIAANSFATLEALFDGLNIVYLLACLSVLLMVGLIGFVDDVFGVRQHWKFLLPFAVALPLMAVKISALHPFSIPFIGVLSFVSPWMYELILIPIGVAAATNLTNTFAGYNGLEAGMGAAIAFFLFVIGVLDGNLYVMVLSAMLLGALLAFLKYNHYPARIFPDDVGTLFIGAAIATIVIIGGIEVAGAILMLPYIVDFVFFKIPHRLPSKGWWGTLKGNKLVCEKQPVHLAQWIMQKTGGISEKRLVRLFIGMEIVLGVVVLSLRLW